MGIDGRAAVRAPKHQDLRWRCGLRRGSGSMQHSWEELGSRTHQIQGGACDAVPTEVAERGESAAIAAFHHGSTPNKHQRTGGLAVHPARGRRKKGRSTPTPRARCATVTVTIVMVTVQLYTSDPHRTWFFNF